MWLVKLQLTIGVPQWQSKVQQKQLMTGVPQWQNKLPPNPLF
jgi:hypothetical protein